MDVGNIVSIIIASLALLFMAISSIITYRNYKKEMTKSHDIGTPILEVKDIYNTDLKYAHTGDAGLDLRVAKFDNYDNHTYTLYSGESILCHTGLYLKIPKGYVGLIFSRSGTACKRDLVVANSVGVIDSNYRGEVMVCIRNQGNKTQFIDLQERIAQLVIVPYATVNVLKVNELSPDKDNERQEGGFGSSGKF